MFEAMYSKAFMECSNTSEDFMPLPPTIHRVKVIIVNTAASIA